jgi:2-polyprenyl-3-methyl-5-hydroxy-6-metoxy-1,4-benzoquinol methylase
VAFRYPKKLTLLEIKETFMERLDLSKAPEQPNIEAAIHFARYAICKNLVKGKRVLDLACGEGYGSYLLKEAGADYVIGVDVSQETISKANLLFASDMVKFKVADAESLNDLFHENEFDVVISIETIEHLSDPIAFLKSIKRFTKPNGVIIMSCPNDHWYYPQDTEANPYHIRKYKLSEFQHLTTDILGNDVKWSIGTGVFGFGSTPIETSESYSSVPGSWMSYMDVKNAYLVNGDQKLPLTHAECSYFIGVWNAPDSSDGIAVFPLSMDQYSSMASVDYYKSSSLNFQQALESANTENATLQQALESANTENATLQQALESANTENAKEMRQIGLRLHASQAERETILESNAALKLERETILESNAALKLELETILESNAALKLERETILESNAALKLERETILESNAALKLERETILESNAALKLERETILESNAALKLERETIIIGYRRYIKLTSFVPPSLRSATLKFIRFTRR